jgi:hypothetical protein
LKNHLASNKHLISSRKRRESALKQTDLIAFVEQCQESDLLAPGEGSKLDSKQVAFRLTVLDTFLSAGCSLGKIDACRDLLEHSGFALTDSSHMRQLIPVLMKNKLQTLTSMLDGRYVSIIFDGTPHVGELLMVFARFWMDGAFVQKLINVRHHSYHPDNRTLAYTISKALSRLKIESDLVVAFTKDSASVNYAAVERLQNSMFVNALNLPCWSHIFNRVGMKLDCSLAKNFINAWSSYFNKSDKVSVLYTSHLWNLG